MTAELGLGTPVQWGPAGQLVVASLAIMASPGPATISLVAACSAFGARRIVGYLAGLITGTIVVLIAVAAGITTVLLSLPALRAVLIIASVGYIGWLAYRISTAPPLAEAAATGQAPSFAAGTLLGFANPKGWVGIAAVFASTRLADGATADAAAKAGALTVMIVVILTGWLIAGIPLVRLLRDPRRARVVNMCLAAAMIAASGYAIIH